jgi:hypothetical protein
MRANEIRTTQGSIGGIECPPRSDITVLHIHPPYFCTRSDDGSSCSQWDILAHQCFPSPTDIAIAASEQPAVRPHSVRSVCNCPLLALERVKEVETHSEVPGVSITAVPAADDLRAAVDGSSAESHPIAPGHRAREIADSSSPSPPRARPWCRVDCLARE